MQNASLPLLERKGVLSWFAAGVVAAVLIAVLYPRLFPLGPVDWQLNRTEAVRIAKERARDLGPLSQDSTVVTNFRSSRYREGRLLTEGVGNQPEFADSRLVRTLNNWRVRFYPKGASLNEWTHEVTLALNGEVLGLRQGVPFDYSNDKVVTLREARKRSADFLRENGLDLKHFAAPVERLVEQRGRTDLYLRYRDQEAFVGDALQYGVESRFAGDQFVGFTNWSEDPAFREMDDLMRVTQVAQPLWIFVIYLIMPPILILFVRRYHAGVVGVNRAIQIFLVILAAFFVVAVATAGSTTEGSSFGAVTRAQNTLLFTVGMLAIYFPAVALLGLMSWGVGESYCQGRWRQKLASFDAIFRGKFENGTVASSAQRGVTAGLGIVVLLLLMGLAASRLGAITPSEMLWGPWWHEARTPGLALLAVSFAFTLAYGLFSNLLLVPPLVERLGPWLGGLVVVVAKSLLIFPPLMLLPIPYSLPLWLIISAIEVFLFIRYDLVTALLANMVPSVVMAAVPMAAAADPSIKIQGWLAMLLVATPLWLSLRAWGHSTAYLYSFDDIPPHVRKIAERERQRVELETARRIQSSILPELPPQLAGVELAHTYSPASEVGGDFYDVLALEDGRLAVAIGDVAGHGVSSGLVMSMARSALAVQVTFRPEVAEVFTTLNRVIYQSARKRLLTTLCYALLDPESREFSWASAGHLYPYRISPEGEVRVMESVAYPLGVRETLAIQERSLQLGPGESVFLSSDGLIEARRAQSDEMFGFDRLEESLARHAHLGAQSLLNGVLGDLDRFVVAGLAEDHQVTPEQDDDLTVLVLTLPR